MVAWSLELTSDSQPVPYGGAHNLYLTGGGSQPVQAAKANPKAAEKKATNDSEEVALNPQPYTLHRKSDAPLSLPCEPAKCESDSLYIYIKKHVYTYIYIYVLYIYIYIYMYIYKYTFLCLDIYIHVYMYIYIQTYFA